MVTNKLCDTKSLMSLLNIFKTWKFWKEFLLMNVAMFVAATAIYYFLLPSNLVVGRDFPSCFPVFLPNSGW